MDPYDLPDEFSHLQALDMGKIGFMQDLIRGIKKIISNDSPKSNTDGITIIQANANIRPLLERVFMCLENSDYE